MRKIFLLLALLIFFVTGCGGLFASQKIVIGIDDEFAPISFHDEQGNLVGFDIDMAKEAARRLNVMVEFKPIDWSNKREELTSGKIDLIWNGLDITEERKEYMIFTRPYMDDRQILLVKKDANLGIHSEIDLEGKVVGVQAGSTSENYFREDETLKNLFREFKIYHKFNEGLDALRNGDIDVFICDELIARYEIQTHPGQFEIIDVKTGFATEMGIGFRKGDTQLRDKIQAVFDEMVADGTAKKISEKWFQADLIKVQ